MNMQIRDTTVQRGGKATYDGACTGDRQRQRQQQWRMQWKINTTKKMVGLTVELFGALRGDFSIFFPAKWTTTPFAWKSEYKQVDAKLAEEFLILPNRHLLTLIVFFQYVWVHVCLAGKFFCRREVGGRNSYPAKHTSTHSYCFFQ